MNTEFLIPISQKKLDNKLYNDVENNKEVLKKEKISDSGDSKIKQVVCGVWEGVGCFAIGTIYSIANTFVYLKTQNLDFSPDLPRFVYKYAEYHCRYLGNLFDTGTGTFNRVFFSAPIQEELVFRLALQEVLLKRVPEWTLKKIAPQHASLVNSKTAKAARIAISALAFSLAHALPKEYGKGNSSMYRLVNTFILGLIFGAVQEKTGNPLYGICLHSGNNLIPGAIMHAIGMNVFCPVVP